MIEFTNVSKIYPELVALEDINFEIEEGEFTFLIGPSGSGKTTIIKLLIKEEKPTEGKIYFYDTDIAQLKGPKISRLRQEISVIFQDFKLLPNKNLYENIAFALEVSGKKAKDIKETVSYVLDLVDLADRAEAFPDEISGGEKQKIAIARAISNNPKVLIADEPTGNLDPESSWDIINLLSKINQWGTTVIMATHGSDIVNTLGKRVIELDKGRIISDNKMGTYPKPPVPIETPKKVKERKKQKDKDKKVKKTKKKKEISKEKLRPEEKKKVKKGKIEEKEFEISFTTKSKVPIPKKGKKKRKGRDVVDLFKLKLPQDIEEKLIKTGITTIGKLRKTPKDKLFKIKGLGKKRVVRILKTLGKDRD